MEDHFNQHIYENNHKDFQEIPNNGNIIMTSGEIFEVLSKEY